MSKSASFGYAVRRRHLFKSAIIKRRRRGALLCALAGVCFLAMPAAERDGAATPRATAATSPGQSCATNIAAGSRWRGLNSGIVAQIGPDGLTVASFFRELRCPCCAHELQALRSAYPEAVDLAAGNRSRRLRARFESKPAAMLLRRVEAP